jgi:hypothetical protein
MPKVLVSSSGKALISGGKLANKDCGCCCAIPTACPCVDVSYTDEDDVLHEVSYHINTLSAICSIPLEDSGLGYWQNSGLVGVVTLVSYFTADCTGFGDDTPTQFSLQVRVYPDGDLWSLIMIVPLSGLDFLFYASFPQVTEGTAISNQITACDETPWESQFGELHDDPEFNLPFSHTIAFGGSLMISLPP